jgi:hypothetical protein
VNEIEARKARAVALLSAWLREEDSITDLLDGIREGVEHVLDCDGKDRSCAATTDDCTGDEKCVHCPPGDCQECELYRQGYSSKWSGYRPLLGLIDEMRTRLERREDGAA